MRDAAFLLLLLVVSTPVCAQVTVHGTVVDQTSMPLPGVTVELFAANTPSLVTVTDEAGRFAFDRAAGGRAYVVFTLVNFAPVRREIDLGREASAGINVVLQLALNADITVTGMRTFANLADVPDPAQNLVGVAVSASQGAITARQLQTRPLMRTGEVLETVPGVVISQHSGEGKANQYYLRGFNLDHGTDFATTVAGMPVNMPTHAHGQGYSDLNFVIPELVSSVQFSKGPYYADQGDFATAGAATINYVNSLDHPLLRVTGGNDRFGRVVAAITNRLGQGRLLSALEAEHNDGPWTRAEDFRKVNGFVRYTRGDSLNALSITGIGYGARWNSPDQIPQRAVSEGLITRLGTLDATDGGDTYRASGSLEWQRTRENVVTRASAYGILYDLNLFSNFTFFLDDPINGDQFHQADHRNIAGGKISQRRLSRWKNRFTQNTYGIQLRNDRITTLALSHTADRRLLETVRSDRVAQTSIAAYGQNEVSWSPWFRTLGGLRVDGYRFAAGAADAASENIRHPSIVSPKGGVVFGPFRATEVYANAGAGFHSNDARGVVGGENADAPGRAPAPLVRARGAEMGMRTVAIPHLQATATAWMLTLASELVFAGDAGMTEAGRPSRRQGLETTTYYHPVPAVTLDADLSWSTARFTDASAAGNAIPGAVRTVIAAGVAFEGVGPISTSLRWRYFGPRNLVEDASVKSAATSLFNAEASYSLSRRARVILEAFNLFNTIASDIDYFYTSRLPGEPSQGVWDVHSHPTLPRTLRIGLSVGL